MMVPSLRSVRRRFFSRDEALDSSGSREKDSVVFGPLTTSYVYDKPYNCEHVLTLS